MITITPDESSENKAVNVRFAYVEPSEELFALLPEDWPVLSVTAAVSIEPEVSALTDDEEKLDGLLHLRVEQAIYQIGPAIWNEQVKKAQEGQEPEVVTADDVEVV